jgi:hypothetical protein
MCVYCKEAPACDHERDSCAASRGERCIECGHGSAAILSYAYTLGPTRAGFWLPPGRSPTRTPLKTASQPRRANAKRRAT